METYQAEKALALARERQHHIAAAARQLETLRILEAVGHHSQDEGNLPYNNNHNNNAALNFENQVNENYIKSNDEEHKETNQIAISSNAIDTRNTLDSVVPSQQNGHKDFEANDTISNSNQQSIAASVLHYADLGLSTELQNILNHSSLDPSISLLGNSVPGVTRRLDWRKGDALDNVKSSVDNTAEQLQNQVSHV